MKISVIGDRDMVVGFQLAGACKCHPVKNAEEARKVLGEIEDGVVIISEKLGDELRDYLKDLYSLFPLVVEIPDKKGPVERVDPLKEMIKKAIGIDIMVKK